MNKINLEIYNPTKTYIYPDMSIATPDRIQMDFSVVNVPNIQSVITTDSSGVMFYEIDLLSSKAQKLGLSMNDFDTVEDILNAMEDILNTPQPDPIPSAEERLAAALEYQNALAE